jgi:hypothetical protein
MSEARLQRPNWRTSGGPQGLVRSASKGRRQWDLLMEGALDPRNSTRWRGRDEKDSGYPQDGQETGKNGDCDRGRLWSPRRTRGWPTTLTRVVLGKTNLAPFGRLEAGNVAAAGGRGVNCVITQSRRCRQRLFDVVVDSSVKKSTFARGRTHRTGRDGQCGASRMFGSWGSSGFS